MVHCVIQYPTGRVLVAGSGDIDNRENETRPRRSTLTRRAKKGTFQISVIDYTLVSKYN